MKKEIKIRIVGTQIDEYGEENKIEFTTEAKYYKKENAQYIVYEESEVSGMENSRTRLKVENGRVQMKRIGQNTSDMLFSQTETHKLEYGTPYGVFNMHIDTEKLSVDIREKLVGSSIDIEYRLTMVESGSTTENRLKIEVI